MPSNQTIAISGRLEISNLLVGAASIDLLFERDALEVIANAMV